MSRPKDAWQGQVVPCSYPVKLYGADPADRHLVLSVLTNDRTGPRWIEVHLPPEHARQLAQLLLDGVWKIEDTAKMTFSDAWHAGKTNLEFFDPPG